MADHLKMLRDVATDRERWIAELEEVASRCQAAADALKGEASLQVPLPQESDGSRVVAGRLKRA